jgi:hypothetical protein
MLTNSDRRRGTTAILAILVLLLLGSIGIVVTTAIDIDLETVSGTENLSPEETAYYEYVAPRLDRLVVEVDQVVEMVDGKSRDILALTVSGNRIETLTNEITSFGESNGVPPRFEAIHGSILEATDTATFTFDRARQALRTFDFSQMSALVVKFNEAAHGLHLAQGELESIADGNENA